MKIGELSKLAGCTPETVRHYERRGIVLPPRRTASGYRDYERGHLEDLVLARHCRALGLSLLEIAELLTLQRKPASPCGDANRLVDQRIAEVKSQIESLQSLMRLLEGLREQCDYSRPARECGILRSLANRGLERGGPRARP